MQENSHSRPFLNGACDYLYQKIGKNCNYFFSLHSIRINMVLLFNAILQEQKHRWVVPSCPEEREFHPWELAAKGRTCLSNRRHGKSLDDPSSAAGTGTHESAWNYHGRERHKLTSIQSSGPTPSTVTLVELLSNTNFNATGFLLVAMVTGTRQSIDSKPTSGEENSLNLILSDEVK